jgi:SAM-dependent methyltransferase
MDSIVDVVDTGGLGAISILPSSGGGPVTPASRVMVRAIGRRAHLLRGSGIDWGTGTGLLAIAASRAPAVTEVVAIEVDDEALETARRNVRVNGAEGVVRLVRADLFEPRDPEGAELLGRIEGRASFLIANPPASADGDGLEWRRRVLAAARRFLRPGAVCLVQISAQYGAERIGRLERDVPGYRYRGVVESSSWVPFDLDRPDLRAALATYVAEERAGGLPYVFGTPEGPTLTAGEVDGLSGSPLTRWQVHRFDRTGPGSEVT